MRLKPVDYDDRQHAVYATGRAMPEETRTRWMQAFADQLPDERPLPIVDLGSGTGRLTPALAKTFGGPVYGVEPSGRMRAIAEAAGPHPGVTYLAGEAAHMPIGHGEVAAVLMFLSFHHLPDRAAAAREIARVLRPGGRVLVRSTFSDRLTTALWWHQFFPRAHSIEKAMFPSVAEVAAVFAPVGLSPVAFVEVPVLGWGTLAQAAQRLRLRAISTFEHLTETEIEEGFARLDAAVASGSSAPPETTISDLLVLG